MRVLIAPDSFKECLDAFQVAESIKAGILRGSSHPLTIVCRPLADGGEGLLQVLLHACGGHLFLKTVTGPTGESVVAPLGLLADGKTAVVESASAAGLHLVPRDRRNPLVTTTRGVGELLRYALDLGAKKIIVGLGGSATNDGGAGMAQALGICLLDKDKKELPPGGAALALLHAIDVTTMDVRIHEVEILGACDVTITLCGEQGASLMYAPQKGATMEQAVLLEAALLHFGRIIEMQLHVPVLSIPGGGAAGGLGAGLVAFTGATLQSGIQMVFEAYGDMEKEVACADIIFSGEGSADGQTLHGKVISGLARVASHYNKSLVVLTGRSCGSPENLYGMGVTAIFPIQPAPMTLDESIQSAPANLARTAESIMRLLTRHR